MANVYSGYCLGNFIGPFFFLSSQAPGYSLGVAMMFFCIGVQVICIVGLWLLLQRRNAARKGARTVDGGSDLGLNDVTDLENPDFKVSGNNRARAGPRLTLSSMYTD